MKLFLNIFGLRIPSYGFCILTGIILSNLLAFVLVRKKRLVFDDLLLVESYVALGMIIFAKLLYLVVSWKYIDFSKITDLAYFTSLMRGGFVFYGGLFGAFVGAYVVQKFHQLDILSYFRNFLFILPFAHGFGRIGCFMAGCCYGIPYSGPFAVTFPLQSLALGGVPLFPVQLVEALVLIVLSFVLFVQSYREKQAHSIDTYLVCYSIVRFLLEYLRYDSVRGHVGIFSVSQWISLVILLVLAIKTIYTKKKYRKGISGN